MAHNAADQTPRTMFTRSVYRQLDPADRLNTAMSMGDWAAAAAACMVTRSYELHTIMMSRIERHQFIRAIDQLPTALHTKAIDAAIEADDAMALYWLLTSWSKPIQLWRLFDTAFQRGKLIAAKELMRLDIFTQTHT